MRTEVRLDPARHIGPISPLIYGQFIEHLGRCIYGGIFDPGSPLADAQGFRLDVLDAVRALRVPIVRWPGGNFVSGYHWRDGVGPHEHRPVRLDLAWRKEETNRFGTDEFLAWCRAAGVEPYICVNMGTGDAEEAAAWVDYCNGAGASAWAQLRRSHGRDEPYGVVYWGLGNEVYGPWQLGHKRASAYAEQAREFARLMKAADRAVRTVAVGAGDPEWDWEVLKTAGTFIDFISVHAYWGPRPGQDPHYSLVARPHALERYLRDLGHLISAARTRHGIRRTIRIAVDEWNVFYRKADFRTHGTGHEEVYDLSDALTVATFLNVLVRSADVVGMANMAQLVNVIAPIVTTPSGLWLQTIYYPLLLHAECRGAVALDALTLSETFASEDAEGGAPYVDVAAALGEDPGDLYVYAVNRSRDETATLELRLADCRAAPEAALLTITGPEPSATNGPDGDTRVGLARRRVAVDERRPTAELPPLTAACLALRLV